MNENNPTNEMSSISGEKDSIVEGLLTELKRIKVMYEAAATDEKRRTEINLYEVPKLMEIVKEVEVENLRRRTEGGQEIDIENISEFKSLEKYGITKVNLARQQERAREEAGK